MTQYNNDNAENGNVLVIILITIALLSALTFSLSKSEGESSSVGETANVKVKASQALKFASSLEYAVNNMLRNGVSVYELNFENDVTSYTNWICPGETRCKVFHPNGGQLKWRSPPKGINDGTEWVVHRGVNVAGVGSDTMPDLTIILPNVTEAACRSINNILDNKWTSIPVDNALWNNLKYQSQFNSNSNIDCSSSSSECIGTKSACISILNTNGNSSGVQSYVFYHLLTTN